MIRNIGRRIFVTNWIGIKKAVSLAAEHEKELKEYFLPDMVDNAICLKKYLDTQKQEELFEKAAAAVYEIGEGGIYKALWDMAEELKCGLEIDVKAIPVRQEIIEVCEYFDIDPYGTDSYGSYLVVTDAQSRIVQLLKEENISVSYIGETTKGPARILRTGERIRYLDKYREADKTED